MMSAEQAHKCGIVTTPVNSGIRWKTATGTSIDVLGGATVNLEVGNEQILVNVVVAKNLDSHFILGTDVMKPNGAEISYDKNTFSIRSHRKPHQPTTLPLYSNTPFELMELHASSTMIIEPFAEKVVWKKTTIGRPLDDLLVEGKGDIEVLPSIVRKNANRIPVVLRNRTNKEVTIKAGDAIATVCTITEEDPSIVLTTSSIYPELPWKPSEIIETTGTKMSEEEIKQLKALVDEYSDCFSRNDEDIGLSAVAHEIKVDQSILKHSRCYSVPHGQRQIVEDNVRKMLKNGVIRKSEGTYTSPIVLVKKHDGSDRFCVDFRGVNAATIKDKYPMPLIQEKLDMLCGSRYFTVLDLTAGYWQFAMDEGSKKWTAFRTHLGVFEFERMPFGLCNAGATFQRSMDRLLAGVEHASPYIDDIIVASVRFQDHLLHLRQVFDRLRQANLKAKTRKCQFCKPITKFLGFTISEEGVIADPEKVEKVKNFPIPKDRKEVRHFHGLGSYYRRFIPSFAHIIEPIAALTRKNVKFIWTQLCMDAFNQIKDLLTRSPILAYPNLSKPFILITDVSGVGLGAVLTQLDEQGRERPISYASKTLTSAERKWSTIERELRGIEWGVKVHRMYLLAVIFTIITDHKPLTHLWTMKEPTNRIMKMICKLQEYTFTIEYRKGSENAAADAMSRIEYPQNHISTEPIVNKAITSESLKKWQEEDEGI